MVSNKNILLGTIGYHNLANHSIGPILAERIKSLDWAAKVDVEEMNWGPIAIVQGFQSKDWVYDRIVFLTAIERKNREVGELTVYKWGGGKPSDRDIQACIGDAVTGVISAENLLIIGEHFEIWPEEVYLVDVEPGPEQAGTTLTVELTERVMEYFQLLEKLCLQGLANIEDYQVLYGDQIMAE